MKLKEFSLKSLKLGMTSDGNGLYIDHRPNGRKSWIYRYTFDGKRREMGLGSYPEVGIADARAKRNAAREVILRGLDPIHQRELEDALKAQDNSFAAISREYIDTHKSSWRNEKHIWQWGRSLEKFAYDHIGEIDVAEITTENVLNVLKPIWMDKTETANRVRGRIETVLDYAIVKKIRTAPNVARWKGHIEMLLPAPSQVSKVEHLPAMPYAEVADFYKRLSEVRGFAGLALQWTILCGCRSGETLKAKWSEIDTENWLWNIPAERMKAKRAHSVPITYAMRRVLAKARNIILNDYIFPGSHVGKHMSDMAMTMLLRRHSDDKTITVHGFRSSMTDFFLEKTDVPTEVVELQLAHNVGNKVEMAYRRGKALQKRFEAMTLWANYVRGFVQL